MKAVVCTKYGPPEVLQLQDVEKPKPKENEVLIKVYATSVHRGDSRMRSFDIPGPRWQRILARFVLGFRGPRHSVLGMELAGKVEAVGEDVVQFQVGDNVFAATMWSNFGAYAEYKCMPADGILDRMPSNITYEEAAVIPAGGITSLGVIRMANIRKDDKVLIYGASGSVGTYAVQQARDLAAEITGVCSTANLSLVKTLGADKVIDYTGKDAMQHLEHYDVIFDAVDKMPPEWKKSLKDNGIYLNVDRSSDKIKKQVIPSLLRDLKQLVESGKLKPVVDRIYPLADIVEAHRYVDKGHKKGNVVIKVV